MLGIRRKAKSSRMCWSATSEKASECAAIRVEMDVTSRESIQEAKKLIQEKEGKLHILVNKCVGFSRLLAKIELVSSAGQVGPVSPFLSNPSAPERKDAETLGQSLFDNETPGQWGDLYSINTFSIFFVTTAFLGLLDKGSRESQTPGFISSVINITSISGVIRLAQDHVCFSSIHAVNCLSQSLASSLRTTAPRLRPRPSPRCWRPNSRSRAPLCASMLSRRVCTRRR